MLLTTLVEAVVAIINSSPEKWRGAEGAGISAVPTMDWVTCLSSTTDLQVLVSPEFNQYNLEGSTGRRTILSFTTAKYISITVGRGFKELPTNNDIAPWTECKAILNLRERITQHVIANPIAGLKIVDLEELPPDELQLDKRNFNSTIQIGFGTEQCGNGPDLLEG